jgi:uncharacterized protein (TIGR02996 family)
MSDAAFLRAICAAPDDDTPRLVYADFLEEAGDPDRAAFVRLQCELARTPRYEPLAVACHRHRREEAVLGSPWRHTLPELGSPRSLEWHPERAFRRGFGWGLVVRFVPALCDIAPRLFEEVPVGELHLPTATLDDWKRLAAAPWLARVKSVHFYGLTTPVEPIRVLCQSPHAAGIEEIVFEKASGPAMPELIADLLRSPLGRQLRGLTLRTGADAIEQLVDSLGAAGPLPKLEQLALVNLGLHGEVAARLADNPVLDHLTELDLGFNPLRTDGMLVFTRSPRLKNLRVLDLTASELGPAGVTILSGLPALANVRSLNLSKIRLNAPAARRLAGSKSLAGLRALNLNKTGLDNRGALALAGAQFWASLVDLDLSENYISEAGMRAFLALAAQPSLTALTIDRYWLDPGVRDLIDRRFGDAVVRMGGRVEPRPGGSG